MEHALPLPEGVTLGVYSSKKLFELWERLKIYDALFPDDYARNPEMFLKQFLDKNTVVFETSGARYPWRSSLHLLGSQAFSEERSHEGMFGVVIFDL